MDLLRLVGVVALLLMPVARGQGSATQSITVSVPYLLAVDVDAHAASHTITDGRYLIEADVFAPLTIRLSTNGPWTLTLTTARETVVVSGKPGGFDPLVDEVLQQLEIHDGEAITLVVERR